MRKFLRSIFLAGFLAACSALVYGQTDTTSTGFSTGTDTTAVSDPSAYMVKGVVRDATSGQPVAAAQIRSLNHKTAATTDEAGNFEIEVGSPSEILIVVAFDYNLREIPVRDRKDLEIDLYSDTYKDLHNEIEGLVGPVRSTHTVNSAKGSLDLGRPTFLSADDVIRSRMNGEVRGISRSGNSGMGSSLFIRGLNSVNMNAQPLIIVDGVIWNNYFNIQSVHDGFYTNPLNDIDMSDIESVTVIRDGTAIYGSKGGNGVIVIKTKRGVDMATKIIFNSFTGLTEKVSPLPMMDSDQLRIYTTDILATANLPGEYIDQLDYLDDDPNSITYEKYHNNTDWNDEVYKQGFTHSYNIGVTGGDEKALYFFSLGYTGNKGVVKTTELQRLNMRTNADFNLTESIKLGMNVGYTSVDRTLLDDGLNAFTSPTFLALVKAPFLNPYSYTATGTLTTNLEDADEFGIGNPTAIIENALNTNKHYRLSIGFKPEFELSPEMTLSTRFDYSIDKFKETYYSPMVGVADRELPGDLGVSENMFKSQIMRNIAIFNDLQLKYEKQIDEIHKIKAVAGTRYISNYFEADYGEGHNSGSDQKRNLLDQLIRRTDGTNDRVKSISNYLTADYSLDNRYYLSAAISADASSRFGRETQGGFQLFDRSWAVFPSVNAAWLISSEAFMANVNAIDWLKLRIGYGFSGNDDIEPFAWTAYFVSQPYMDRANGLVLGNIGNSEIQWETTAKASLGLDAILFNNRLSLTADVYSNTTNDLLFMKSLPEVSGSGYYWGNGGKLSNKGFELSADLKLLDLSNLKWEAGAKIGHYKNKIESLPDGDYITSFYGADILTSVGNPAGVFYGYRTQGVLTTEEAAANANLKLIDNEGRVQSFEAGDMHFVDSDNDGFITGNDREVIGDPNPDFYGSFNSKVSFLNFTFEMLFTYSYGNDVYNALRASLESGSLPMNQTTAMLNRWFYEGQETTQPKVAYMDPMGNARFSDRWIEDGSFLRFKTLSLGYEVPLKSSVIEGLNVWVSANNLFTLSNYLGHDPEVSVRNDVLYQGIDTGLLPLTRSYFIGIKMNL